MALTYSLITELSVEPRRAAQLAVSSTGSPRSPVAADPKSGVLEARTSSGLRILSRDARPDPADPHDQEAYASGAAELGFTPLLRVVFRLDKFADVEVQMDDVARAVAAVLGQGEGDAAVLFEEEVPWLRRIDGEFLLSDDDEEWPPSRQALLPEPRRVVALDPHGPEDGAGGAGGSGTGSGGAAGAGGDGC